MGFFEDYFTRPIIERSGYNLVNTLTYAIIAIAALYLIWRFMKANKFDFSSRGFLFAVAAFVLFGSTCRVLTDLSDSGALAAAGEGQGALAKLYAAVDASAVFQYGYLTVTPGIYLVTAAFFLLALAIGHVMKREMFAAYAGFALWLPLMLLLIPFMEHLDFAIMAIAIACAGTALAIIILQKLLKSALSGHEMLAIAGQATDGAATFVVLDIFAKSTGKEYFEQHVLSAGIGESTPLGFFLFLLLKVALAGAIVYFLRKEKMDKGDVALVLLVVAIMGFAPGIRDLLRMLCGT